MLDHNNPQAMRLSLLREKMRDEGFDGLIVPRFDAHMAEYVAPCDQRLAWATGFTGSAGVAVITMDEAVLFIDGRYTVQAAEQCPAELFTFRHLHDEPLADWLRGLKASNKVFGFDPMHVSLKWHAEWTEAAQQSHNSLVATNNNLIDALWLDQPTPSKAQARPFTEELCGETSSSKRDRIASELRTAKADLLVENQPDNIAWLLNIRGDDIAFNPFVNSFLTIDQDGTTNWYVAQEKVPQDLSAFELDGVHVRNPASFLSDIESQSQSGKTFSVDPAMGAVAVQFAVGDEKQLVKQASPITLAKAKKNQTELQGMRDCHVQDGIAWLKFMYWLEENVQSRFDAGRPITEMETVEKITAFRQELPGFEQPSFDVIAGAGPNGAMCHYKVTEESNSVLDPSAVYLHDSGGQFTSGTTDATRTFVFNPQSNAFCENYTAVLKGLIAVNSLKFPPKTYGHHIDALARAPLWAIDKDFDHGTGHGVGHNLSVHEQPQRIGRAINEIELVPGMILTIEPGYYVAGEYGIRIENLAEILEEPSGFLTFKSMTLIPIDAGPILVEMLTDTELTWLNQYHQRVRTTLEPLVPGEMVDYLHRVTAPLSR